MNINQNGETHIPYTHHSLHTHTPTHKTTTPSTPTPHTPTYSTIINKVNYVCGGMYVGGVWGVGKGVGCVCGWKSTQRVHGKFLIIVPVFEVQGINQKIGPIILTRLGRMPAIFSMTVNNMFCRVPSIFSSSQYGDTKNHFIFNKSLQHNTKVIQLELTELFVHANEYKDKSIRLILKVVFFVLLLLLLLSFSPSNLAPRPGPAPVTRYTMSGRFGDLSSKQAETLAEVSIMQLIKGSNCFFFFFPRRPKCDVIFNSNFAIWKNLILFSIRVKELFEPMFCGMIRKRVFAVFKRNLLKKLIFE